MSEHKLDINLITIEAELQRSGDLNMCGGFVYLAEVQKALQSMGAIPGSLKVIKKHKTARELSTIGAAICDMSASMQNPDEILSFADEKIRELSLNSNGRELTHIKYATGEWLDTLERQVLNC
jgi:replicative DNA helicase